MQAVWETSSQSGSALLLLLALADHASDDGWAWPRVDVLAAKTRLGERYVRKLLADLERSGDLSIEPYPDDRRRHAYHLGRYCPADTGTGVPVIGGPPVPVSEGRYRNPGSGEWRLHGSATYRNPRPGFPNKEYPSVQPSLNPFPPGWAARVERVRGIWDDSPAQVERPEDGRIGGWLQAWDDDEALMAALSTLRRRGALALSVNYVHTCLAAALRNGGRIGLSREEREIAALRAPGYRDEAAPLDVSARLEALAAALPPSLPDRECWAEKVLTLTGDDADAERVEAALTRLDAEMLAEACPPDADGAIAEAVSRALRGVGGRLPAESRALAAESIRRRLLRRSLGLPVLSLFSPAAEACNGAVTSRGVKSDG